LTNVDGTIVVVHLQYVDHHLHVLCTRFVPRAYIDYPFANSELRYFSALDIQI